MASPLELTSKLPGTSPAAIPSSSCSVGRRNQRRVRLGAVTTFGLRDSVPFTHEPPSGHVPQTPPHPLSPQERPSHRGSHAVAEAAGGLLTEVFRLQARIFAGIQGAASSRHAHARVSAQPSRHAVSVVRTALVRGACTRRVACKRSPPLQSELTSQLLVGVKGSAQFPSKQVPFLHSSSAEQLWPGSQGQSALQADPLGQSTLSLSGS